MAWKLHADANALRPPRAIDVHLGSGLDVAEASRRPGISDATSDTWRWMFGGMEQSQLSPMRALETENQRLRRIVAKLELDKLILKESLDPFKPKA